mmetsp:Transcript_22843/g.38259  ORF Transcript_22843/g.38259 Transcript_22843/m.38259 type:complete len:84 (+) Transcript_22843:664-915(+)
MVCSHPPPQSHHLTSPPLPTCGTIAMSSPRRSSTTTFNRAKFTSTTSHTLSLTVSNVCMRCLCGSTFVCCCCYIHFSEYKHVS